MDELNAPTRAEIRAQLENEREKPVNKGLKTAAMRLRQRDRLDTFLRGKGLSDREIQALASDIDSYYPENFTPVDREV